MTDNMISRDDVIAILEDEMLGRYYRSKKTQIVTKLRALPAYEVGVKPLEWRQSAISSWNDDWHTIPTAYTVRCADENGWKWTGLLGGFGHTDSPQLAKAAAQADYAARIRSALTATPAQDVVGLVDALDKTTAHGQRVDFSRVGHSLSDASWHVHLAGFRSRDDAGAFLSAALARMKGAGE